MTSRERQHPNCVASEALEEKTEGNKDGVWFLGILLFESTTSFSFPPFPYCRASNLRKIDGNFSWEIVTSSAVLDHWVKAWVSKTHENELEK